VASRLDAAMFAASKAMPDLKKDSVNPHFKNTYASLGAVLAVVKPVAEAEGLLIEQAANVVDHTPCVTTRVTEVESGDSREYHSPVILDKETMQGLGSAITYAKRYALVSIFLLDADEDDDGNAASEQEEKSSGGRKVF